MHLLRRLQASLVAAFILIPCLWGAEIASTEVEGKQWGATKWVEDDLALFGGRPLVVSERTHRLIVRYSYFVAEYNVLRKNPVWVAHIDTKASVQAMGERTDKEEWGRSDFKPDANVVTRARQLRLDWVKDSDFTNALGPDQRAPVAWAEKYTRGHMASNVEMKSVGTPPEGKKSQEESFSLANVAPQMQRNNSVIWQEIEGDCARVAAKWDRVAVITGPVFALAIGERFRSLNEGSLTKVAIPVPTHFFKVIITRIDGRLATLAYLVPHDPKLERENRFDHVKSVGEIEALTGINLMPAHGRNRAVEGNADPELLAFLKENQNSKLPWEK